MPNADGSLAPGDPGYVAPATGLMNTPPVTAPPIPSDPAVPIVMDPSKTVSGGVQKLIAQDSPLMQQATARAAAKMNERGLLNSSQAITAGQSAVLDAATPIAAADAQQATSLALADKQALTTKYTADLSSQTQLYLQHIDNGFKTTFQTADTQGKLVLQAAHDAMTKSIADVEANYKTLMQTSASASDIYKSTMAGIANIYADTSIDAAGKAATITGYLGWMKKQLTMIGSVNGIDLTGLSDFGTVAP